MVGFRGGRWNFSLWFQSIDRLITVERSNAPERLARRSGLPGLAGAEDRDEPLRRFRQSADECIDVRTPKFGHIRSIHS